MIRVLCLGDVVGEEGVRFLERDGRLRKLAAARREAARPADALREADVQGRAIDGGQIRRQRHGRQDGKRGPPRPRAKLAHAVRIRQGGKCLKCL